MDKLIKQPALAADLNKSNLFSLKSENLVIEEKPTHGIIRIQGPGQNLEFCNAFEAVLDLSLPAPCQVSRGDHRALVWSTPNEWLLFIELDAEQFFYERLSEALTSFLALATIVSDSRLAISISGSSARELLSKACSIDFYPKVFAVNHSAVTLFAGIVGMVIRRSEDDYYLYIDRPFKSYILGWLDDSAQEFVLLP